MIGNLTAEQIEEVLKGNVLGHLGCNDGYNTYVYPLNYVYTGKFIICHSQAGSKIQVMRQNKRVCLEVDEVKSLTNWKSVMVLGEYQELNDERDRYDAMKTLLDKNLYLKISESLFLQGSAQQRNDLDLKGNTRPAIFRIVIDEKTGRFENE